MRKNKFRIWTGRIMLSSQDIAYAISLEGEILKLDIYSSNETHLSYKREPVKDMIALRFTGLLDKNGKEIFESDILKDNRGHTGIVEWSGAGFTQKVETKKGTEWWSLHNRYEFQEKTLYYHEVIGNIYETLDLLEAK